jgi:hypothetical protein
MLVQKHLQIKGQGFNTQKLVLHKEIRSYQSLDNTVAMCLSITHLDLLLLISQVQKVNTVSMNASPTPWGDSNEQGDKDVETPSKNLIKSEIVGERPMVFLVRAE